MTRERLAISDADLLQRFATAGSDASGDTAHEAFAQLVDRHLDMVYRVAVRELGGNASLAEDVAQAVFMVLAAKARTLLKVRSLAGWLHHVTRCAAVDARRRESRRNHHERGAAIENGRRINGHARLDLPPAESESPLDAALSRLTSADREALVLRFFQDASFAQIGIALSTTADGARQRTRRALGRLKKMLAREGSLAPLAVLLNAHSGAAPAGLASHITQQFLSHAAGDVIAGAMGGSRTLAKGVLTMMNGQRIKLAAAAAVLAAAVGVALTLTAHTGQGAGPAPVVPTASASIDGNSVRAVAGAAPAAPAVTDASRTSWRFVMPGDGGNLSIAQPDDAKQPGVSSTVVSQVGPGGIATVRPDALAAPATAPANAQFVLVWTGTVKMNPSPETDAGQLYEDQGAAAAPATGTAEVHVQTFPVQRGAEWHGEMATPPVITGDGTVLPEPAAGEVERRIVVAVPEGGTLVMGDAGAPDAMKIAVGNEGQMVIRAGTQNDPVNLEARQFSFTLTGVNVGDPSTPLTWLQRFMGVTAPPQPKGTVIWTAAPGSTASPLGEGAVPAETHLP